MSEVQGKQRVKEERSSCMECAEDTGNVLQSGADSVNMEKADKTVTQSPSCCSGRHKQRTPEEIRSLLNRLSRIEGQIRGIRGMVENGAYCPDILIQSSAVTAAMNSFNKELLASHIRSCVAEDIRAGDDSTIDELVKLLQKLMK